MIVGRLNFQTHKSMILERPFIVDYGNEPIVMVLDQSSTCTGLTIGTKGGSLKEVLCFYREKGKGETTEGYLDKLGKWLTILVSNCNVIDFSNERFVSTRYHTSDRVTKQVLGKIKEVYELAITKDSEGNSVRLKENAINRDINSKSWQSLIVPQSIKKQYDDIVDAYHTYACTILPGLVTMGADASSSLCMYLYLMKTNYSEISLEPDKAHVKRTHNLAWYCLPFSTLEGNDQHLVSLGEVTSSKYNREQLKYLADFRLVHIKRFFDIFMGVATTDEIYLRYRERIDTSIGNYLRTVGKEEVEEIQNQVKFLQDRLEKTNYKHFIFNDKLSAEDNLRALTHSNANVYYSEVTPCLHYCYLIPMFNLKLQARENILLFGIIY